MNIRYNYQGMLSFAQATRLAGPKRRVCEVTTYQREAEKLSRDDVVLINGEQWLIDDVRSVMTLGKSPVTEYTITASQPLAR